MKLPKDRPINDYLRRQYKAQETRIKQCGLQAKQAHEPWLRETIIGTIYTFRFSNNQNI